MNAFGDGIEIMSVVNPETLEVFSASVGFRWEGRNRLYKWETADVTAVQPASVVNREIRPAKLLYPSRQASILEMALMARFADFGRHEGSALKQLRDYVYLAAWLSKQAPVARPIAA
jgi:hypothetical protein